MRRYNNPLVIFSREIIVLGVALVITIGYAIYNGEVPGLNPINATIYIVAAFLFIPSYIQAPRTYALAELRKYGGTDLYVFSRELSFNRIGSNYTWVGVNDKNFRIDFSTGEQGARNAEEVKWVMSNTPKIIWLQPGVWVVIYSVILALNILLDNGVSYVLGSVEESTDPFRIILYYLPSIFAFALPIISFIFVRMRDNHLYECASKLAEEIEADLNKRAAAPMKCFRTICPICGTRATSSLKNCVSCGAPLEVQDDGTSWTAVRFTNENHLL